MNDASRALDCLSGVIAARRASPGGESYTSQLFSSGVDRIGEKVVEEAGEAAEAAREPGPAGREHLIREAADLLYHLLVLLAARDANLADVETELARRFGVSGLEEKSSRGD